MLLFVVVATVLLQHAALGEIAQRTVNVCARLFGVVHLAVPDWIVWADKQSLDAVEQSAHQCSARTLGHSFYLSQ